MTQGEVAVHTLGPSGTNCEAAAKYWLKEQHSGKGRVILHPTLEQAVPAVLKEPTRSILLGCVVYPKLHEIVFQNLRSMALRECFMMPTHPMILAAPQQRAEIRTVLTHPAPVNLLDGRDVSIELASSNAAAAAGCAQGQSDACITTRPAAEAHGLVVIEDFGPVSMGFSIHVPYETEVLAV
ncbi:prephenate dehydratase domain-containing protein [Streptomyces sp. NPDC050759]|uniref:prephenate dehydratase domain-containing protein n=1 Tax=Streptomyces sp. NPDC050759 TaxID=3365635 RepID=UPI0037A81B1A